MKRSLPDQDIFDLLECTRKVSFACLNYNYVS
jgi:hypothetical protein